MSRLIDVDLGVATRERELICPRDGRAARCALIEDTETRQWIGVERCSRLEPADDVRCDQRCVHMLNLGFTLDTDGDG
ncbi:MAG TPA: hypothetical protein VFF06_35120 [Polyangia bacterium]|nr:hypothetical protein [Polyangia bacterium]